MLGNCTKKKGAFKKKKKKVVETEILNCASEIAQLLSVIPAFDCFREVRRPRNCTEGRVKKLFTKFLPNHFR